MFKLILRKMQINENLVPHFTYDIGKKLNFNKCTKKQAYLAANSLKF